MRKPSEVIARAIQLDVYRPEFTGQSGYDWRTCQPFLCNVIKHCGEFEKAERYNTVRAIDAKLGDQETLFGYWTDNVKQSKKEEFTREWALYFWACFVEELQSRGR